MIPSDAKDSGPGNGGHVGGLHPALYASLRSAFTAGVVTGGIYLVADWIERIRQQLAASEDEATSVEVDGEGPASTGDASHEDDDTQRAASLLGVSTEATEQQIRSALRARFKQNVLHPDHGGDAETARDLIAAKNLLIERARLVRA